MNASTSEKRLDLETNTRDRFLALLLEYRYIFSNIPSPVYIEPRHIDLVDNIPVVSSSYNIAYAMREPCRKRTQSWLQWEGDTGAS